jgi:CheY-like chemotaxis protein
MNTTPNPSEMAHQPQDIAKPTEFKYNKVMLIDDNEVDNFITQKTIELMNFSKNVLIHTCPKSAIEFLTNMRGTQNSATRSYPDVIFIDLNMPEMDGFQFLSYFKALVSNKVTKTKLVVLTSSIFIEDEHKIRAISNEITFIRKPITQELLMKI